MAPSRNKMRNKQQQAPLPTNLKSTPWIVFPFGERSQKQDFYNLFDKTKKSYDRSIPEIHGKDCLASMHGWLVLRNLKLENGRVRCFLWNPQTRKIVDLPLENSEDIDSFYKCYLTSPPTDPDCMVLFVSETTFLFCQPQDRKWRKEHYELPKDGDVDDYDYIQNIVTCSNGTIYALTTYENIAIINRKSGGSLSVSLLDLKKPCLLPEIFKSDQYVLESFGDIYLVMLHYLGYNRRVINHVEVFRLSFANKTWVKVQSIGEVVFIISYYGCMSLPIPNSGLEGNRKYFTIEEDKDLYVYGIADESLWIYSACSNSETCLAPFWLLPENRYRQMEIPMKNANTTTCSHTKTEEMHSIIEVKEENIKDREVSCWTNLILDVLRSICHVCKTAKLIVPPIRWTTSVDKRCTWLMFLNRERCKYNSNHMKAEEMHSIIEAKEENIKDRGVSCWTNLTGDNLRSITKHLLFGNDYMNIRLVCKTWKVSLPPIRWTTTIDKHCPWLMFSNRERCKYSFLDPVSDVKHSVDIPDLLGARIWFSKDSWLLMSKGYCSVFFYNPFNCVTIKLPDFSRSCMRRRMSFSSLPTSTDCIVYGVSSCTTNIVEICYMRIREKSWTMIKCKRNEVPFILSPCSPIFHDGAFYCLSYERHLGVFRLKDDDRWEWTILASPEPYSFMDLNYLVECKGYLLSVTVGSKGKWVKVHKLDCSNMTWMIQNSLEDQTVFVSKSTSIALQGANRSMQNKIYFPLSLDGDNNHVFFSLETGRWGSSRNDYSANDIFGTKQYLHCTWIQPILSWK